MVWMSHATPNLGWQKSRSPGSCQCHLLHSSQMHPAMVTGAHMPLRNLKPTGKGIHSSSPHHRTTHPELRTRIWALPITYRVFPQLLPKWQALLTSAQVPGNCKGRKASVSNRHPSSGTPLTTWLGHASLLLTAMVIKVAQVSSSCTWVEVWQAVLILPYPEG